MTTPSPAISGLGPHGEFAASLGHLRISPADADRARAGRFHVAMVLHTTRSDWASLQVAGVRTTLESYGASLVEVVDCDFRPAVQISALESLVAARPDAIISLPVHNLETADAHRSVALAGIRLVLMDNAPAGLRPRKEYVSLVSADNFGNGQIAASLLASRVPTGGRVGVIGFGMDFFVTNEREIAFHKWMKEHRPDIAVVRTTFASLDEVSTVTARLVSSSLDGLFVVWDEPALAALETVGEGLPVVTIDLGHAIAEELARDGAVKGVAAQQPYDQGVAEATAALLALVGAEPPAWIALPGLAVSRDNVVDAWSTVWHSPPPPRLLELANARGA